MNKNKKTIILLIFILSLLILLSVFIIILSKILEIKAKKKNLKLFSRPRVTGTVCGASSFDLSGGNIRVRNGCFQGFFVFVNPFDNNTLILSKTFTIFQYSSEKSIYRNDSLTNQDEYVNVNEKNLLYMDTKNQTWYFFPAYGMIAGTTQKWTIIERNDNNGFFVWTLALIDKSIQDPVSSAWIVEKVS
jgi:hypothetical protein